MGMTLYEKIRNEHLILEDRDGKDILYVDRHYLYEVSSPQAFDRLRENRWRVRRPGANVATMDHNIPTVNRHAGILDRLSKIQVETLARNCDEFGIKLYDLDDPRNGITHVIFLELGYTQPGMLVACGDSHTSTHGAFGALAFGITSDVEHILATQTLRAEAFKSMLVEIEGASGKGVTAKDLALYVLRALGAGGATGFIVEFGGKAVRDLSVEGRMTLCNMAAELNAKAALISPDRKVYEYLEGRPFAPRGEHWDAALEFWKTLPSDDDAEYDKRVRLDISSVTPHVTWGTSPSQAIGIDESIPFPAEFKEERERQACENALRYMDLRPGTPLEGTKIDSVFIGSCTNGRIEDLREAARILRGNRMAKGIWGIVVPGSLSVKKQAEEEGLADIFLSAGFEWRDPGCSMCLGMNGDVVDDGKRCASTSNRNFENRQGKRVKTFLLSPAMAAAASIEGKIVDVRRL